MYQENDYSRQKPRKKNENYRSDFRVDYARLLHSASFRRLQGKKQLFSGFESDFFRNRLTHSLEVAQVSKAIASKFNRENSANPIQQIDLDLVEFAALAHDLGHPPFGHNGEEALDEIMREFGGFEGNAQTLHILTKIEKKEKNDWAGPPISEKTRKDERLGLNLCYRSIASILKYDNAIPRKRKPKDKVVKGYYHFDKPIVEKIKQSVSGSKTITKFKTIECTIMDVADDISYSTYDLEDSLKANFISPLDFINLNEKILNQIRVTLSNKYTEYKKLTNHDIQGSLYKIFSEFFEDSYEKTVTKIQKDNVKDLYVQSILLMNSYYSRAKLIVQDGYERTFFSSHLVKKFMNGVRFNYNSKNPELSYAYFESETKLIVEVLKTFNYINIINSPMLKVSEHRGKEIIKKIFEAIDKNIDLMPDDHQLIYNNSNDEFKKRTICDFISGMTDRYAVEYYSRLYSSQPESIFKPF